MTDDIVAMSLGDGIVFNAGSVKADANRDDKLCAWSEAVAVRNIDCCMLCTHLTAAFRDVPK